MGVLGINPMPHPAPEGSDRFFGEVKQGGP